MKIGVITDIHFAKFTGVSPLSFFNFRFAGLIDWMIKRRSFFSNKIRERLREDILCQEFDALVIAGDLTTLALSIEFKQAIDFVDSLKFSPANILVIPGNHDAYLLSSLKHSVFEHVFSSYIEDFNKDAVLNPYKGTTLRDLAHGNISPRYEYWPQTRIIQSKDSKTTIRLVGLNSAIPSLPLTSWGKLGNQQLSKLNSLLADNEHVPTVISVHHPPALSVEEKRKRLIDGNQLLEICRNSSANIKAIVHGHLHRLEFHTVQGVHGELPIIGAPSSVAMTTDRSRAARYPVIELSETTFSISWRQYSPSNDHFIAETIQN